jgi:hypothetical protein
VVDVDAEQIDLAFDAALGDQFIDAFGGDESFPDLQ